MLKSLDEVGRTGGRWRRACVASASRRYLGVLGRRCSERRLYDDRALQFDGKPRDDPGEQEVRRLKRAQADEQGLTEQPTGQHDGGRLGQPRRPGSTLNQRDGSDAGRHRDADSEPDGTDETARPGQLFSQAVEAASRKGCRARPSGRGDEALERDQEPGGMPPLP